ncbi:type IX secretion system membrane protein PorP/SprF [Zeaxanthinibacter sp. PT1]|uniref:PorP/SprF family type IX secretion system membrane protein n=1 Tax=Zeaxanthinibacter TaxID=561554 RepID=UPI00234B6F97|nr:type IX secretion system membrane protein PorP/SprF [Zeaxanthinibacter sp. PT1]MDC6352220.1 type IX secretion system membrane protein PorP/SprF [Zeaxanthinibacter sp. PT1]
MKKQLLFTAIFSFFVLTAWAQQDPMYIFYRYNMNLFNPAYAGSGEGAELGLGLRSQWAGVEGAPESQSAIFSMPVGRNIGLGVTVLNDKTFVESQTWVGIDFSYALRLNHSQVLYLGIKGSGNSYNVNSDGLVTYGVGQDGSLSGYDSRFTPNVGVGAYLKADKYFVSLSAPKLLGSDRLQERDGNAYLGEERLHAYLMGGCAFALGNNLELTASSMLRYVDASPISVDMTAMLNFGQRFDLGASYRFRESISGLFLFKVSNSIALGYAYEAAVQSEVYNASQNSHEIFMRLQM